MAAFKPDTIERLEAIADEVRRAKAQERRRALQRSAHRRHPPDPGMEGRRARVTVRDEDFEYQGRPYKSLSAIARAITGTRWNGLVFFGLKSQRSA